MTRLSRPCRSGRYQCMPEATFTACSPPACWEPLFGSEQFFALSRTGRSHQATGKSRWEDVPLNRLILADGIGASRSRRTSEDPRLSLGASVTPRRQRDLRASLAWDVHDLASAVPGIVRIRRAP